MALAVSPFNLLELFQCISLKSHSKKAGTLGMCCNPSHGAMTFGWIQLRLLVWRKPGHKEGNSLRVPKWSNLSVTIPGGWNAGRFRQEESLDASATPNHTCRMQGCGFDSGVLVFPLQSRDNENLILVSILCLLHPIIVNGGRIFLIVSMCNVAACSNWISIVLPP